MKRIKAAVIGYGGMGGFHCRKFSELEEFELAGIYDISESRNALAEERGIHAYATLEELLADPELELVTIATPNHVHRPIAIQAMEAGKHVVCEKPVALNHEELQEMIRVAKEKQVIFTVHQN